MTLNVSYFLLASVVSGGLIESQGFGMNSAGREDGGREEARSNQTVLSCEFYANLQACHDALPATGGTMLLPPNIAFSQSKPLLITKSNVALLGGGIGGTIIQRSSSHRSSSLVAVWGANFRISGLTLDGNRVLYAAEELFLGGTRPTVDGIEVKNNTAVGIAVGTTGAIIRNCSILGIGSPSIGSMGIWFDSPAVDNLVITGNVIKDQRLNGIFGSGKNVQITSNYLSGNHRQTSPVGGGQIAIKGLAWNSNISIMGNTIEIGGGSVTSGIEIDGPAVNAIWNTIKGQSLYGIILQSGYGHQLIGNTVLNSGTTSFPQPGISVSAGVSAFSILGNQVHDDRPAKTQSWGVRVQAGNSSDYIIAGNDLRGNMYSPGLNDGGQGPNRQVYGNP